MIAAMLAMVAAAATPFRCGAVERPGIAVRGEDGEWRGAAVDLCRQAARSERGPGGEIVFRAYRQIADLREAPHDALAVLSPAELAIAQADARVPSGSPIAISRQLLLIRPGAPLHRRSDLAGRRVCFIVATAAEAALNAWAKPAHVAIQRVGFQEPVELRDAFDAGYCAAMAVDAQNIPGGADHTVQLGAPLAEVSLYVVRMGGR